MAMSKLLDYPMSKTYPHDIPRLTIFHAKKLTLLPMKKKLHIAHVLPVGNSAQILVG